MPDQRKRELCPDQESHESNQTVPTIFPLSARKELDETLMPSISVYKKYFEKAFSDKNIRNIVITGAFGIGKSSVIKSFEKFYCGDRKGIFRKWGKNFLYISLGDYECAAESAEKRTTQKGTGTDEEDPDARSTETNNGSSSVEDKNKQDVLMRRMLLQLYARFHQKDLPASSFEMIRENKKVRNVLITTSCVFMAAVIFLLAFYDNLSHTVKRIMEWKQSISPNNLESVFLEILDRVAGIAPLLHLILYIIVCVFAMIAVGGITYYILTKLRAKAFVLKMDRLEAEYENEACESYLDRRTTEIVYCLEQVASRINYTVVFEDLDRIDPKTCVDILTRLREINYLVNLRMKHEQPFRFLYVINDSIYASLDYTKFFDYTLPLFASLNEKSADDIFRENFHKVNENLKKEDESIVAFDEVEKNGTLICCVSKYLQDYRLQYTILNEYSLLLHLFIRNKCQAKRITADEVESVLAFAIYKVCWPEDYNRISQGKSEVFPVRRMTNIDQWQRAELLKVLTQKGNDFLTPQCLYVAGYQQQKVIDSFLNNLKKRTVADQIAVIQEILPSDIDLIEKVFDYAAAERQSENKAEQASICGVLPVIMELALNMKKPDVKWFYDGQDLKDCIKVLCDLETNNPGMAEYFIEWSKENRVESAFETCSGYENKRVVGYLSKEEKEMLNKGKVQD